jgi:protein involved in polysaccharide export with SLBB domain
MKLLRNIFVSCAAIWALLVLAGCATDNEVIRADAAPEGWMTNNVPDTGEIIRAQEALTIEMYDTGPGVQKLEQTVADDGTLTLPLISDRVPAAGKKVGELQDAIHDLYVPRYYKRMTVSIKRENRFYFVRGQVKNPSQRPYTGDMTLTRAIASAGDFTDYADRKNIRILRSNGVKEKVNWLNIIKNPKKYDVPIYPGDSIHVPLSVTGFNGGGS